MTLHMLRLDPDMRRAAAWGAARGLTPDGADQGYLWHALLTAVFGGMAPRPWRLMEPRAHARPEPGNPAPPHLLGYAEADGATLAGHAALHADPSAAVALGLDTLAVKRMPDGFPTGQRLRFEARVRPVMRSNLKPDGSRGGRDERNEIDAALHAALAAREADALAPLPDAEEVYKAWMAEHLARGGARADMALMSLVWRRRAAIARRDAQRRLTVSGRKGGGPDICLAGVLEVEDPLAFPALLARGVGRHRAFGFGMLLLRPC